MGAVPAVAGCQSTRRRLPARALRRALGSAECCHGTAEDRTAARAQSSVPRRRGEIAVRAVARRVVTLLAAARRVAPPGRSRATPRPRLAPGPTADGRAAELEHRRARAAATVSTLRADGTIVRHGTLGGEVAAPPLLRGRQSHRGARPHAPRDQALPHARPADRAVRHDRRPARPRPPRRRRPTRCSAKTRARRWPSTADEVAVAWVDRRSALGARHRYRIAFSRGGRAFGTPQTLATTELPTRDSESIALAYGGRGDLIVAYSRRAAPSGGGRAHAPAQRPLRQRRTSSASAGRSPPSSPTRTATGRSSSPGAARTAARRSSRAVGRARRDQRPGRRFGPRRRPRRRAARATSRPGCSRRT